MARPGSITAQILATHRDPERARPGRNGHAGGGAVRVDHVVVEGVAGALTLRLADRVGAATKTSLLVVGAGDEGQSGDPGVALELERLAGTRNAAFARGGLGPIHQVFANHFAAPGRIVLGLDPRLGACGALGTLAFAAHPVELAAVLGGASFEMPDFETLQVRLFGRAPGWVSGDDLAIALDALLGPGSMEGRIIEFDLAEPEGIGLGARWTVARHVAERGALAGVFGSDEATRRGLRARGREAEWRSVAAEDEGLETIAGLDFSNLEPWLGGGGGVEGGPLRERLGTAVDAVWLGPELSLDELARAARRLRGAPVHERVALTVTVAGQAERAAAAREGWLKVLREAGVVVRTDRGDVPPPVAAGPGLRLACGFPARAPASLPSARWQRAGVDTCLAAALAGAIADPRGLPPIAGEEIAPAPADRLLVRLRPADAPVTASPTRRAPGPSGPMRGVVLLKLEDRAAAERLLPGGARVRSLELDLDAVSAFACSAVDPAFPARARAHGGGLLVAGSDLGAGPRREVVGLVAAHLGVRAILARSFSPSFRRQLRQHGILALRFVNEGDYVDVRRGDELELPDLPEGLEAGKPLVVRNLTRGGQYTLLHDLDVAGVTMLRAGGLLAAAAAAAREE